MSEAAIMQAAREAAATRVYRSDGDLWTDGPINLSKFVRFLARQPYVVADPLPKPKPKPIFNQKSESSTVVSIFHRVRPAQPL